MAFTFDFDKDDLEDEVGSGSHPIDQGKILAQHLQYAAISSRSQLVPPQKHTLQELLLSLPSQLSYNLVEISNRNEGTPIFRARVPRRALFDIRQQLMWEADPSADTSNLLEGLATGDLQQGTYEGGFKTWECSVDLAQFLVTREVDTPLHIIELGAGSAVPSLLLLIRVLQLQMQQGAKHKVKFTLCDYNVDVLRLCTAMNVFLAVAMAGSQAGPDEHGDEDGELEVTEEQQAQVLEILNAANVEVNFVSGAWGDEFYRLLDRQPQQTCLVLASETVYSPTSLNDFVSILMKILQENADSTALVAAKKVYFGVGGGIAEFETELRKHNGSAQTVVDVPGSGVGRVILNVFSSSAG